MRSFKNKTLILLISVSLLSVIFPGSAQSQEIITLRIATWLGAEEIRIEEKILSEFTAQNPGVEVEIESIPNSYKEKILTSFAAGTAPDVFVLDSPIIPALLNKDVLLDLNPYVDELNVNPGEFFPNVLSIFQKGKKLYAFPKDYTPLMLYYNKKLFDEAGIAYPEEEWKWNDYLEIAKKLTKDSDGDGRIDQWGTMFRNQFYLWEPWVWMTRGDYLNTEGTSAKGFFNSPETERALQFLVDLRVEHGVSPSVQSMSTSGGAVELFLSGRIAMSISGHWRWASLLKYVESGDMDIGVIHLPYPEDGERVNIIFATGWCVPKNARYPDLSIKLAAFLGSRRAAEIRLEHPIGIPGRVEIADRLIETDPYGVERIFINETQYGRQPWGTIIDEYRRIEQIYQLAVEKVMIGGEDIHEVCTDAAESVDLVLKRAAKYSNVIIDLRGNREIMSFLIGSALFLGILILGVVVIAKGRDRSMMLKGYAFLAPSMIVLMVFIFVPVIFSLFLSFHHWNVVSSTKPFIGLENYRDLLSDNMFWSALKNTFIFSLHVPIGMAISLCIALLLNRRIKGGNVFRTLFFLPSISSFVAVALVWKLIYNSQFGLANYLLEFLGINGIRWLEDPSTALISVMLLSIWMGIGYQMVIFIAGLKNIPKEFYEAARTDGANAWAQFRHITFPLLMPTTFFILVTSLIGSFQVFSLIYIMTEGGPLQSTDVAVYHIYKNAWEYLQMGYASAMSWVLFFIIMIITWLQFRFLGKKVEYN
ncbi:MAG: extracellular solute-binding protein [bacterium]|nr:extracellular solute-binding protein [bacterium]